MYSTDLHRIIWYRKYWYLRSQPYLSYCQSESKIETNIEAQIKEALEKEIQMYVELNDTGGVAPPMLWDAFKAVMRGNIIARTAHLKN